MLIKPSISKQQWLVLHEAFCIDTPMQTFSNRLNFCPSSGRPSDCLSLSTFSVSSQEPLDKFWSILARTKYCEIPTPKWKYIDMFLKIFICRTIVQVSAKVNIIYSLSRGTQLVQMKNYTHIEGEIIIELWDFKEYSSELHWDNFMWIWICGIQDFSNEEQCPFPMKNEK